LPERDKYAERIDGYIAEGGQLGMHGDARLFFGKKDLNDAEKSWHRKS
jgi:hypothetical protein